MSASEPANQPRAASSQPPPPAANQLENIKVAVRLRPFTEKERQRANKRIVDIEQNTVALYNPKPGDTSAKKFTFDYSYWSHDGFKRNHEGLNVPDPSHSNHDKYVGQDKVFDDLGRFLLDNAIQGYNSALLAYGQTGSGKSYTVSGYGQNEGILPRFARALFVELNKKATVLSSDQGSPAETKEATSSSLEGTAGTPAGGNTSSKFEVYFSMLEIYNEVVRDLLLEATEAAKLARRGLKVREHPNHGFFVENLTSLACSNKEEIERRIEEGQLNKSIAATSMNETSSRGHTIYEFRIKQYQLRDAQSPGSETITTTSVVQLVDLAGSERMMVHITGQLGDDSFVGSRSNSPYPRPRNDKVSNLKTARSRQPTSSAASSGTSNYQFSKNVQRRFKESVSINQSLSTLGNCIQVMSQYSQQYDGSAPAANKKLAPKIPYRDSVLTKLLNRCCLNGNSKVVIIANLSPAETSYDDTLSTLRFADRAKQIRTHAIVNQMSHGETMDILQKENERLKQIIDGRVTRSDDSSQTSNFDDSESVLENFTGAAIKAARPGAGQAEPGSTPVRSKTTVRKSNRDRKDATRPEGRLVSSTSHPSLKVKDQMKQLVSPASRKLNGNLAGAEPGQGIHKSRSIGHGLAKSSGQSGAELGAAVAAKLRASDDDNDGYMSGIKDMDEGELSSGSDSSLSALTAADLTDDEKIEMFNRLLSNTLYSTGPKSSQPTEPQAGKSASRTSRPKKANNRSRAGIKHVSMLGQTLKKSNPFLSNLNPDEQLTGMISYIIKQGATTVGKDNDCDIILHGPEIKVRHAIITRTEAPLARNPSARGASLVEIEPIQEDKEAQAQAKVALMVNGHPVAAKTRLNNCDRLLFGSNTYFVYVDTKGNRQSEADTVADLDLVTYDMARAEVLRKVLSEAKNEATIKEIKDYTHRPGTGKLKAKRERPASGASPNQLESTSAADKLPTDQQRLQADTYHGQHDYKSQEELYRDLLMQDTYEYALPVAEINAVAKEMDIKVVYSLKILTGEEQISEQISSNFYDTNASDGFSSSSTNDCLDGNNNSTSSSNNNKSKLSLEQESTQVTQLTKLDSLDIPPALYIKVHSENHDFDFYWSKQKFQARRFKILELYGPWEVGGKSALVEHLIDQSRVQGDYLIDPFIDEPSATCVLVGHAQITLQPISHLADIDQSYDILDLNDEIVGSINVVATPCHPERAPDLESAELDHVGLYRPFSERELKAKLLNDPSELINKKLVFRLKVVSCRNLPEKYVNVFCQYSLNPDGPCVKTKMVRDESLDLDPDEDPDKLMFDHSHYICFEKIDQDMLDFLEHGFLTIQVIGQYKLSTVETKNPTLVSTIIKSINKYKFKMDQRQGYGDQNFSDTGYFNSDSARSMRAHNSGAMNSASGASSDASTSATVNMFDGQNEDDETANSIYGMSQESVIDLILTKRKLDRAENQLHYLKRTINIAEHYNKKHIPVKTVKKLLNSYGQQLDNGNLEETSADVPIKGRSPTSKNSACSIQ